MNFLCFVGPLKVSNKNAKFLGVHIDTKLTWKYHITRVRQNTCKNNVALRSLCNKLNSNTAYYGLLHSKMTYSLLVWSHTAHRKAIRLIAGLKYRDDCRQAFVDLGVLIPPCCFVLQCLLYAKETALLTPTKMKFTLPLRSFKLKIKSFLLSHVFYSTEEYLKTKMLDSLP
nr:unnamed protein product [Callosobruchus analis]